MSSPDEQPDAAPEISTTLRAAWKWWRPHLAMAVVLLVLLAVQQAFVTSLAVGLKVVVDDAQQGDLSYDFPTLGLALTVGFALAAAAGLLADFVESRVTGHILARLRTSMYAHLQRLGVAYTLRTRAGEVLGRFSSDLDALRQGLTSRLVEGARATIGILLNLPVLFALDPRLAVLSLVSVPVALILVSALGGPAARATLDLRRSEGDVLSTVQESLRAQPVISAFSLRRTFQADFARRVTKVEALGLRAGFRIALVGTVSGLSVQLVTVIVTIAGAYFVSEGSLGPGSLVAYVALHAVVGGHASDLGRRVLPALLRTSVSVHRVDELLNERPRVHESPNSTRPPPFSGALKFEDVSFAYNPDRPVFAGLNLHIRAGEHVALVGPSGCGKSSVLQLILRFYDPDSGRVTQDGIDLRHTELDAWRDQLSVVMQDTVLLNDSIGENIRVARPQATDLEVQEAARLAAIDGFIRELPQGYDTPAGEAGAFLSGGQRQRIAIARAILRDPRILLLDEATSALDPGTEEEVASTLGQMSRGRTVVTVTHRLSAARSADRIVVIEQGRILEQGSHEVLLQGQGRYAELWAKQTGFALSRDSRHALIDATRLRAIPLFAALDESTATLAAQQFVTETFEPEELVFRRGDVANRFYVIVRGQMDVLVSKTLSFPIEDGDFFGEIALLDGRSRTATVRARTKCVTISLERDQFAGLLERTPSLRLAVEQAATHRIASLPVQRSLATMSGT